eukprot:jgi/Chlat1/758/Chrsp104S01236
MGLGKRARRALAQTPQESSDTTAGNTCEADDKERFHAATVEEWGAWLERNHRDRTVGVWLVTWKTSAGPGRPRLAYSEAVTEALRFGWIDSKPRKLDEHRSMLWFSPRRPCSAWSAVNKARIMQLEAEGRMQPAGAAVVAAAKESDAWSRLDEVEALVVPADLATAFDTQGPAAWAHWNGFPRSARRGILEWIMQARLAETRRRRVEETAECAAKGERANRWPRRQ